MPNACILSEFVRSIPAEKINLRRGGDFRTIAEHVIHLARVQPMLLERLQRFMAEDRFEFGDCDFEFICNLEFEIWD
jgi:hypothetical protein